MKKIQSSSNTIIMHSVLIIYTLICLFPMVVTLLIFKFLIKKLGTGLPFPKGPILLIAFVNSILIALGEISAT